MKFKKKIALGLAALMMMGALVGCSGTQTAQNGKQADGKVSITIADWPDETDPNGKEINEGYLKQMNEKYPDINIITDTTVYADAQVFQMKAAANQLPTMYNSHFTEIKQTAKSGYAADLTDVMKKNGILDALNPALLDVIKGDDGKIYAYPINAYLQGLTVNKKLFTEAGLVNEDGSIKLPSTYEEMAEYAKIIKDKTGVAGYAISTTENYGGWHFMNIAWSYGVNFMEQMEDGKWKATFNSPECVQALQFIKDLKWKYDVLPQETVINQTDLHKMFASNRVAMIIETPSSDYSQKYGMSIDDIVVAKMPGGPAGRYVQMGGSIKMFDPKATPEQLDASMKWLALTGYSPEFGEEEIENTKKSLQNTVEQKGLVLPQSALPLWTNPERIAKEAEVRADYVNVDPANYADYFDLSGITIRPEEPVDCQQLYAVLDGCIQEVITNKDADCEALIAKACSDFQVNHLDKH
ncbi:MAG: hypothetical protein J6N52_10220 [Clostridia bacterium]|nr:hypothetical protein [Clostridia bacterium]